MQATEKNNDLILKKKTFLGFINHFRLVFSMKEKVIHFHISPQSFFKNPCMLAGACMYCFPR